MDEPYAGSGGVAMAMPEARRSEVQQASERLHSQIASLELGMDALANRLQPVLRPSMPEPSQSTSDIRAVKGPSGVEVADTIEAFADRIDALGHIARSLEGRVAV